VVGVSLTGSPVVCVHEYQRPSFPVGDCTAMQHLTMRTAMPTRAPQCLRGALRQPASPPLRQPALASAPTAAAARVLDRATVRRTHRVTLQVLPSP
jgi:hypothetical protein